MPSQRLHIEYPIDAPYQDFHCPLCGAALLKANRSDNTAPCEHVDFLFIEELAEFDYLRPEFREAAVAAGISLSGIDPSDAEEFTGKLAQLKDGSTSAFFHVTTLGMSCCRSVAVTVVIGLDFYRRTGA